MSVTAPSAERDQPALPPGVTGDEESRRAKRSDKDLIDSQRNRATGQRVRDLGAHHATCECRPARSHRSTTSSNPTKASFPLVKSHNFLIRFRPIETSSQSS